MHDLAIVGAGPAGLALAYYLRDLDLDICILEATEDIGGRTKSVELAGAPVNTGAMFVYGGTRSEELAHELGQPTAPFRPTTYGIHFNGRTSIAATDDDVVGALPLAQSSKAALLQFMDGIVSEYQANVADGSITSRADGLADQTVADRLVGLPEDVASIIESAVRGGSVGDSSQLSAKYALRYLGSYMAKEQHNRLYPINGMQEIPRALAARLAPRTEIRTGTKARLVEPHDGYADVHTVSGKGGHATLQARHVVLTIPAPLTDRICPTLPDWKRSAFQAAKTPGSSTLTVAADIRGLPEFADWAFVSTVGKAFDAIINPTPGTAADGIVRFTCYGNSAGFIPGFRDDDRQIQSWIDDFLDVAPPLKGRIIGSAAQTWKYCFAVLSPRRAQLVPTLRQRVGNIHFAGDYTSITAGSHGAYDEAHRVAADLRTLIAEENPSAPAGFRMLG